MGTTLPCSVFHKWLPHTSTNRVGSIELPRKGAGPSFLSAAPGGVRDSSPTCMTTEPALLPVPGIDRCGEWISPQNLLLRGRRGVSLSHSALVPSPKLAHLCFPYHLILAVLHRHVQGSFSHVLLLIKGSISSPSQSTLSYLFRCVSVHST